MFFLKNALVVDKRKRFIHKKNDDSAMSLGAYVVYVPRTCA